MKYLNWDDIFHRKLVLMYFHHLVVRMLLEKEDPDRGKYLEDYYLGLRNLLKYNYDHRSPVPLNIIYQDISFFLHSVYIL